MNEDFVTYELAVKLKEKGYPQRTFGEYDMQGACYNCSHHFASLEMVERGEEDIP